MPLEARGARPFQLNNLSNILQEYFEYFKFRDWNLKNGIKLP